MPQTGGAGGSEPPPDPEHITKIMQKAAEKGSAPAAENKTLKRTGDAAGASPAKKVCLGLTDPGQMDSAVDTLVRAQEELVQNLVEHAEAATEWLTSSSSAAVSPAVPPAPSAGSSSAAVSPAVPTAPSAVGAPKPHTAIPKPAAAAPEPHTAVPKQAAANTTRPPPGHAGTQIDHAAVPSWFQGYQEHLNMVESNLATLVQVVLRQRLNPEASQSTCAMPSAAKSMPQNAHAPMPGAPRAIKPPAMASGQPPRPPHAVPSMHPPPLGIRPKQPNMPPPPGHPPNFSVNPPQRTLPFGEIIQQLIIQPGTESGTAAAGMTAAAGAVPATPDTIVIDGPPAAPDGVPPAAAGPFDALTGQALTAAVTDGIAAAARAAAAPDHNTMQAPPTPAPPEPYPPPTPAPLAAGNGTDVAPPPPHPQYITGRSLFFLICLLMLVLMYEEILIEHCRS